VRQPARGHRRRVRRHPIITFLVVLVVLFVVVDRVAAAVAGRVVASRLADAEDLSSRPDVSVRGFPLLTQVAAQEYQRIDVTARDVRRGRIAASRVELHLHGVHVATRELLSRNVSRIPVDRADGTVLFGYGDLDRMLAGRDVSVRYDSGDRVRVSGTLDVEGRPLPASGTATVRIDGDQLVVTAQSVQVSGAGVANGALSSLARGRLSFRLLLADLPFDVSVDGVDVGPDGVLARVTSPGFVIDVSGG